MKNKEKAVYILLYSIVLVAALFQPLTGELHEFLVIGHAIISIYLVVHINRFIAGENNQKETSLNNQKATNIPKAPGMTGVCEECGTKVRINYGNAYQTLCKECA